MDWNSTLLCPTGLSPWTSNSNDIAPCFQQLFLQIPSTVIFATLSAYHCGRKTFYVLRNDVQLRSISLRILSVLVLGLFPLFKFYYAASNGIHVWPIDILVGCVELISFFVHLGFLFTHRRYGDVSQRGPLFLNVVWCVMYLLAVIWVFKGNPWPWSFVGIAMHTLYAVSMVPSGSARVMTRSQIQQDVSLSAIPIPSSVSWKKNLFEN